MKLSNSVLCIVCLNFIILKQISGSDIGPQCPGNKRVEVRNCTLPRGKIGACARECLKPKTEYAELCCHLKQPTEFEVYYCCEKDIKTNGDYPSYENAGFLSENTYAAALGWFTIGRYKEFLYKCSGVFISPKYVLTAAHCASFNGDEPNVVLAGGVNLLVDVFWELYTIEKITVHSDYDAKTSYNDIALIEIVSSFEDVTMDLWRSPQITNTTLIGMGYGDTTSSGMSSNELLVVDNIQYIPNSDCQKLYYLFKDRVPFGIGETLLCARNPKNLEDYFQGNSGGPLIMNITSKDGQPPKQYLVGITSFAPTGTSSLPVLYTRISSYLAWIDGITSKYFNIG